MSIFPFPPLDTLLLLPDPIVLGLKFGAELALLLHLVGGHDEFHATRLAGPVLSGTMLAKVSPLEAVAGHLVLVVITHR